MNFRVQSIHFLATGGWVGTIKFMPGTFGSLAALPLCWLVSLLPWQIMVPLVAGFIAVSIRIAGEAEKNMGVKDPGAIVIDEIDGMLVTFAFIEFTACTALMGFILFRILDIIKPPPIRQLERHFSGGLGIVIDDVAAGIGANLLLQASLYFIY
jgi:phosphatidylglycerophosphatase A